MGKASAWATSDLGSVLDLAVDIFPGSTSDLNTGTPLAALFSSPLLYSRGPPRERKIPGSNPACAGIFSGSSHTSDLKTGTPVATLPGAWRYRVSVGTGWPGVSIL